MSKSLLSSVRTVAVIDAMRAAVSLLLLFTAPVTAIKSLTVKPSAIQLPVLRVMVSPVTPTSKKESVGVPDMRARTRVIAANGSRSARDARTSVKRSFSVS